MDRMISDEDVKAIGGKMRDLRLKLGFTQQDMANELFPRIRRSKVEKPL